ncbi:MAG: nucleoside-diphosphate kinase [Deltaproteobacteria bacterium]|nr:MAG: nucleoside-diphosphate kinase [Deltaproteobacteria bacterium]
MERTLSIIKPDGVAQQVIGAVISRFENENIRIVAMRMAELSRKEAEGFYAVHKGRPFFSALIDFMISGPLVLMVLEGEDVIARNRQLMGATRFEEAAPGTIRKDFGTGEFMEQNVVHGSDGPKTAAFEISYFFRNTEIVSG